MPHVDLTAAPSGAALPQAAVPDGRSPRGSGFAAVLAHAQSAGESPVPGDRSAGQTDAALDDTAGSPHVGKGDAQLTAWLVLNRLSQQITGAAGTALAAAAERKATRLDGVTGNATELPDDDGDIEAAPDPGDAAVAVTALALGVVQVPAHGPVLSPADVAAGAGEDVDPGVSSWAGDLGDALMAGPDGDGEAITPVKAPLTLPERTDNANTPSIRELLAELRIATGMAAPPGDARQPAMVPGAPEGQGMLAAAVARAIAAEHRQPRDPHGARVARDDGGTNTRDDRTGAASDRASAAARALAARFQASDASATSVVQPAAAPAAGSATALRAEGIEWPRAVPSSSREMSPAAGSNVFVPLSHGMTIAAQANAPQAVPVATTAISGATADDLHSQVVQAMRVQWSGTAGDAHIRLQPHYLGELTISLKVEHGSVTAQLAASSADVRQWLESNEALLRQSLAQHDLRLEKLVIREDDPTTPRRDEEGQGGQREAERQPHQRRRREPDDATFEVVV